MAAPLPHGYRSITEYHPREDQGDAIVRVAAYHRKDYGRSVDMVLNSRTRPCSVLDSNALRADVQYGTRLPRSPSPRALT
ncbi:hypothetical protein CGRA01v4_10563 [Colletotrichum graminicola]|nr:hypothetical protein CGRA01v4_10563 [Colletotrichum graminicola]